MNIAIIGAGGAGGLLGAKLIRSGHNIEFLVPRSHWEALRTTGLRVESPSGAFSLKPPISAYFDPEDIRSPEVVILAVKAGQVRELLPTVGAMLGPGTIVLTVQNGVRTVDEVEQSVGPNPVYGGTAYFVSYLVVPGHIRHLGIEPRIVFGNVSGRNRFERTASELLEAMQSSGIDASINCDIRRVLWSKMVLTAAIGTIGALTRVSIGEFRRVPETRQVLSRIMREVVNIARGQGIELGNDCVERTLQFVDAMPPESTSSLQRDITLGKSSELEYVVGDLVRYAAHTDKDATVLNWAYACLKATEVSCQSSAPLQTFRK